MLSVTLYNDMLNVALLSVTLFIVMLSVGVLSAKTVCYVSNF